MGGSRDSSHRGGPTCGAQTAGPQAIQEQPQRQGTDSGAGPSSAPPSLSPVKAVSGHQVQVPQTTLAGRTCPHNDLEPPAGGLPRPHVWRQPSPGMTGDQGPRVKVWGTGVTPHARTKGWAAAAPGPAPAEGSDSDQGPARRSPAVVRTRKCVACHLPAGLLSHPHLTHPHPDCVHDPGTQGQHLSQPSSTFLVGAMLLPGPRHQAESQGQCETMTQNQGGAMGGAQRGDGAEQSPHIRKDGFHSKNISRGPTT